MTGTVTISKASLERLVEAAAMAERANPSATTAWAAALAEARLALDLPSSASTDVLAWAPATRIVRPYTEAATRLPIDTSALLEVTNRHLVHMTEGFGVDLADARTGIGALLAVDAIGATADAARRLGLPGCALSHTVPVTAMAFARHAPREVRHP